MTKTKQISLFIILCLISISVLTGCQNNNTDGKLESTFEPSTTQDSTTYNTTNIQIQTLVLDHHGCIGCGICTQVAPQNFSMQGRKAIVTSQEKITSNEVKNAIEACPVSVIEIIEA